MRIIRFGAFWVCEAGFEPSLLGCQRANLHNTHAIAKITNSRGASSRDTHFFWSLTTRSKWRLFREKFNGDPMFGACPVGNGGLAGHAPGPPLLTVPLQARGGRRPLSTKTHNNCFIGLCGCAQGPLKAYKRYIYIYGLEVSNGWR